MRKLPSCLTIGGFCLLVLLMAWGCGSRSQFIIMPDPDGKVGRVEVITQGGSQILDQPWQSIEVRSMDQVPGEPKVLDEKKVKELFKDALEARPETPVAYLVYFETGGIKMTADSRQLISEVVKVIKTRNPLEISISGHTDAVGSLEFNRILSLKRANAIASILVSQGVNEELIEITYHGKENPLIRTPDGVAEPMNRRVEIRIR